MLSDATSVESVTLSAFAPGIGAGAPIRRLPVPPCAQIIPVAGARLSNGAVVGRSPVAEMFKSFRS